MKKVAFHTLGCKANQYDARVMMEKFTARGWQVVDLNESADVFIVNSCAVTSKAARQSRQKARQLKKLNPGSLVVLAGCYPQAYQDAIKDIDGVDLFIGTDARDKIVELVENLPGPDQVFLERRDDPLLHWALQSYPGRVRAFMKVQEGCEAFCSYCIVPRARGAYRSKPLEVAEREAKNLLSQGFQELVVAGIHLGAYGRDLEPPIKLAYLLERIIDTGVYRLRLSSLEVNEVDNDLLNLMAESKTLCPHLHLPLQSGSDRILKAMNRSYTAEEFYNRVKRIREKIPDIAITADVMVGFPGETEEDFQDTVDLVKKIAFSRLHVFPFSPRPGTPAAAFSNQLPAHIKKERSRMLRRIGRELLQDYNRKFLGRVVEVIKEDGSTHEIQVGTSPHYLKMYWQREGEMESGSLMKIRGKTLFEDGIWGEEV